jgi:anti-sigma B factor antagonist
MSSQEIAPRVAVVTVTGNVRIGPESEKVETVTRDLLSQGYKALLFDFSGVGHMDSTGVGRFIASLTMTMNAGAELRIAGANSRVRDVFRVTRLDTIFKFFDDIDAARRSLA